MKIRPGDSRIIPILLTVFLLAACQPSIPAATALPTVAGTNTPAPAPTQLVKSGNGTTAVTLKIDNKSSDYIAIDWINFDGVEESTASAAPGTTLDQGSYDTHIWRIRNSAGTLLAEIALTADKVQMYEVDADQKVAQVAYNPCKLPEAADRGDVGLGFPRYAPRMASTGTVKAAVLFVDFSDAPASQTPEQVFSIISPGAPDFYKAVSYGRMDFQLLPNLKWLRMSKKSSEYGFGRSQMTYDLQRAYMQEAMNLADADVDFSGVQAVDVIANPAASNITFGPAFSGSPDGGGITADAVTLYNGTTSGVDMTGWGFLWLNHETGHTMGLVDLYAFDGTTDASIDRFTGDFSLMGNLGGKAPEELAYERWLIGWLDDSQVICQESGDVTTTLTPIETAGGVKAVMVPTGTTTGVMVEYRQALDYDKKLPKAGALVYTIDTSVQSGMGPIQILPVIPGDSERDRSPLAAGESITIGNVTIKVTALTADNVTVEVTVAK